VAADLICRMLDHGRIIAIDRSEKMISAALRRNARHVETSKADFLVADVEHYRPGTQRFDLILAIRVGLFHRERQRAHALVTPWLRPGGRIVAISDQPALQKHPLKKGSVRAFDHF